MNRMNNSTGRPVVTSRTWQCTYSSFYRPIELVRPIAFALFRCRRVHKISKRDY